MKTRTITTADSGASCGQPRPSGGIRRGRSSRRECADCIAVDLGAESPASIARRVARDKISRDLAQARSIGDADAVRQYDQWLTANPPITAR